MELEKMLDNGRVVFTFRKRDGSVRRMHGTRNRDIIPVDHRPADISHLNLPEVKRSAVTVFDLDEGAWRSYRPDTVIEISSYRNF